MTTKTIYDKVREARQHLDYEYIALQKRIRRQFELEREKDLELPPKPGENMTKTLRGKVKDLWPHLKVGMKIKRYFKDTIIIGEVEALHENVIVIKNVKNKEGKGWLLDDFSEGEIEIEIDEEPRINKRKGRMGALWDQLKVGTKLRCIASQSKFEVLKADGDAIQLGYLDRPEEKCVPIYRYNLITSSEIEILDEPTMPKKGRICDLFPQLKVGMRVRTRADGGFSMPEDYDITGIIDSIKGDDFYIRFDNTTRAAIIRNMHGSSTDATRRGTWHVHGENELDIEILEDAPNIPLSLDTGMTVENIVKMAYKDFLSTTKQEGKIMSLVRRFKELFVSEPTKSFAKLGVVDSEGHLTSEGYSLLLNWLLTKHGDEFKKEVVDKLLEEKEKECECK